MQNQPNLNRCHIIAEVRGSNPLPPTTCVVALRPGGVFLVIPFYRIEGGNGIPG